MVPAPLMGTGWQRDTGGLLKDLQEAAAHLAGPCPVRGDGADGAQEGEPPCWCTPWHRGGPTGCHHHSLVGAEKAEDVQKSAVDVLVFSACHTEKRKCFFKSETKGGDWAIEI